MKFSMSQLALLALFCLGLNIVGIDIAYAGGTCVFNDQYFTADRYENEEEVKSLLWIEDDDVAKLILQDGSLVSVKHWSCNHVGLQAKLYLHPSRRQDDYNVRSNILKLGRLVLDKTDEQALNKALGISEVGEDGGRIDVPGTAYSEFYASVVAASDSLIITINYYRD